MKIGSAAATTYGYDPDGNQVARVAGTTTTLYLGDDTITLTSGTITKVVRAYSFPGSFTSLRVDTSTSNNGTLYFEAGNTQNTQTTTLTATTLTVARRAYTPFGEARTTTNAGTWPADDKTFLNAPTDANTKLVDLGARQYDPTLGRFESADPIAVPSYPQQLDGYSYSDNDPVNDSDPSGNAPMCVLAGNCTARESTSGTFSGFSPVADDNQTANIARRSGGAIANYVTKVANKFATTTAQQIYSNLHGLCSGHVFGVCIPKGRALQTNDIIAGYSEFFNAVRPGGQLDIKITLNETYGADQPFYSRIPGSSSTLYSDVWGNILYGYEGRHSGFTKSELIDGSHGKYNIVGGLNIHFNAGNPDPTDDTSIKIGYALAGHYGPGRLTQSALVSAIQANIASLRANGKIGK